MRRRWPPSLSLSLYLPLLFLILGGTTSSFRPSFLTRQPPPSQALSRCSSRPTLTPKPSPSRRARGAVKVLLEPPMRYNSEDWFYNILSIPRSKIIRNIRSHLITNTVWALLVATIHHNTDVELHVSPLPHTLITSALGLLLVFRTNSAYERFWEARKVWGTVTNVCRNLGRTGYTALERRYHVRFTQLVIAFPMALKAHLQCHEQGKELELLLGPIEAAEVREDPNPPAAIANKLTHLIVNAIHSHHVHADGPHIPSSLSPLPHHHHHVEDHLPRTAVNGNMIDVQYIYLQDLIGELVNCLGMCERILMTPIPPSYSRHTSRLLSIYCLTLPFVLVEQLGVFTVPATVALCWGLFSIEEIGHYIEEPFRNQLPLDRFTKNIMGDVERLMRIRVSQPEQVITLEPDLVEYDLTEEEERQLAAKTLDELQEIEMENIQRAMARYEEL